MMRSISDFVRFAARVRTAGAALLLLALAGAASTTGCKSRQPSAAAPPRVAEDPSQLPEPVLRSSAKRYGGFDPGAEDEIGVVPSAGDGGVGAVIGPIESERMAADPQEARAAARRLREVLAASLAAGGVTVVDAPGEQYVDDSPRPDLARQGVRYVVKGVASRNADSGETTIFVHAVHTVSGQTGPFATARSVDADAAVREAVAGLLEKLQGERP